MLKPEHLPERKDFQDRLNHAFDQFNYIKPLLMDIRDYFGPRDADFEGEDRKGERNDSQIINERAIFAARTLQQGMASGMTPRSRPWLRLLPPDPDLVEYKPVKVWLSDVRDLMSRIHLRSNIYGALYSTYGALGKYGTDAFQVLRDYDTVVRAERYPLGTWAFAVDHAGKPCAFYRRYKMSVSQMIKDFGKDNLPRRAQMDMDSNRLNVEHDVVHVVEPNAWRNLERADNQHMAYIALYYAGDEDEGYLRVSGHTRFPIVLPRWAKSDVTVWGSSPAMDVLGSVKQLQVEELVKGEGLEKMVNPPLQAPAGAQNNFIDRMPGGVSYYDELTGATQGIRSLYDVNFRVDQLAIDIERVETRINEGMFADLFLMISADSRNQRATAYEIAERKEEKLLALGPVLEGVDNDLLDPVVDLTFDAMVDANLLGEVPQEVQGSPLQVEYISILHQAQRAVASQPIERYAAFLGSQMEAFPEIRHKYDALQAADEYAAAIGVAPRVVRSDAEVEQLQQAEAQAKAQAMAMEQAQQAAQGAKLLSDTRVGEGSALDVLTGTTPAT
jgi:hypothetical protein